MKVLPSDRHRAFVLALYQIKPGYGAHVTAAKLAGFGSSTSSPKSWSVIASRLAHDEKILAALHEEDQKHIRASAPRAVRALGRLIEDPDHKDHARGIAMVLDRVHPTEQRHVVDVHHHVDHDAEAIAQLRMLKGLGVARAKLEEVFGFSGLSHYERLLELEEAKNRPTPMIEGRATEIKPGNAA
jgi:phage terminase small subunit